MFVKNEKLQAAMKLHEGETHALDDELDSFSYPWLRHAVHPVWIHSRFMDDKLKDYIVHVLVPFVGKMDEYPYAANRQRQCH